MKYKSSENVWIVMFENVGYSWLPQYIISVFADKKRAEEEVAYLKDNPRFKFVLLEKQKVNAEKKAKKEK